MGASGVGLDGDFAGICGVDVVVVDRRQVVCPGPDISEVDVLGHNNEGGEVAVCIGGWISGIHGALC